jgi:hypothetical protein
MNHDEVARRIAHSHALIQTKPVDRLDYINKSTEIKQVIMGCVAYLDQLYYNPDIMEYTEADLSFIHESICVSAIPLLHMIEHFLDLAKAEVKEHSLAV